jgi:hypothetical protein
MEIEEIGSKLDAYNSGQLDIILLLSKVFRGNEKLVEMRELEDIHLSKQVRKVNYRVILILFFSSLLSH